MSPGYNLRTVTLSAYCLVTLAGSIVHLLGGDDALQAFTWLNGAALLLSLASILGLLARDFPTQNLLAICAIIGVIGWIEIWIPGSATSHTASPMTALILTVVWSTVLLTSRFMARLILKASRGNGTYAIRVWLLASLMAALLNLGISILLSAANPSSATNPGVSSLQFLRSFATALVMMICTAPWLIPKRPVSQVESLDPIVVWLGENLLCGSAAIHLHAWRQAAAILTGGSLISAIAMISFTRRDRQTSI
jgi:hypothetical protein